MEAKKSFTAVLFDNSNYDKLEKKERCLFQHSFGADTYFSVGENCVQFRAVHGTMTFEHAKSNLEWFLNGIPYKEII
jgi:hypothetical protein